MKQIVLLEEHEIHRLSKGKQLEISTPVEERICNNCLSPNQALRTASLFGIRIVKATRTA